MKKTFFLYKVFKNIKNNIMEIHYIISHKNSLIFCIKHMLNINMLNK